MPKTRRSKGRPRGPRVEGGQGQGHDHAEGLEGEVEGREGAVRVAHSEADVAEPGQGLRTDLGPHSECGVRAWSCMVVYRLPLAQYPKTSRWYLTDKQKSSEPRPGARRCRTGRMRTRSLYECAPLRLADSRGTSLQYLGGRGVG